MYIVHFGVFRYAVHEQNLLALDTKVTVNNRKM
jgi:hypothetical protein